MTGRRSIIAFALLASLAVAAAPVAAQSEQLVVVSQHTTATDLGNGQLSGVSVQGSGTGGLIAATSTQSVTFTGTNVTPTSTQSISVNGDFDPRGPGGTGDPQLTVTGTTVWYNHSVGSQEIATDPDEYFSNVPETASTLRIYIDDGWASGSTNTEISVNQGNTDDGAYDALGVTHTDTGAYDRGHWATVDLNSINGSDGLTVELNNSRSGSGFQSTSGGNVRYESIPPTEVTVADGQRNTATLGNFTDGQTKTATIDLTLVSNRMDWSAASSSGRLNWTLDFTEYHYDAEGSYKSQTHQASKVVQGFADLTLTNATADVAWEYYDGTTWQVAKSATYSTSGNHTLDLSTVSAEQWRVNVSFDKGTGEPVAKLSSEGVQFNARSPDIDNGSASPSGGETLNKTSFELSVPISDRDFSTAQGDNVTVDIFMNGSKVDTQYITSNQTVSTTVNGISGGTHEWSVETSDEYGLQTSSQTFSFSTPDTLYIYNESNPSELIKNSSNPIEITVQFISGGDVYQRTTTDGTVDFDGLPADQEFLVRVSADGYYNRRIYITSLIEQQSIYLLPTTADSADIVFSLNDKTGEFVPTEQTTLFVEKALNKSGDTRYRTIVSDQFSATGDVPVTLENNERYRLRVESPSGQQRVLGAYTTAGNDNPTLTIGQISFEGANATSPTFKSAIVEENGSRALRIAYRDPAKATTGLSLEVYNMSNESDYLRPNTTETGPYGTYIETIPLPANASGQAYVVRYHADREGADTGGKEYVGDIPKIAQDLGLDPRVLSLLGYIAILATLGLTAVAYPRFAGLPTFAVATGLVAIGAVSIHPLLLAGGGVTAVLFAAGGGR